MVSERSSDFPASQRDDLRSLSPQLLVLTLPRRLVTPSLQANLHRSGHFPGVSGVFLNVSLAYPTLPLGMPRTKDSAWKYNLPTSQSLYCRATSVPVLSPNGSHNF